MWLRIGSDSKKRENQSIPQGHPDHQHAYGHEGEDAVKPPLPHSQVEATVQRIFELISMEGLLMKFHATRPMAPTYRSEVLPFVLMVSNRRGLADELHNLFSLLCNNACLSIVRVRMRPDRMKRQPLAVRLGQCAENLLDVAKRAAKLPGTWARAAQATRSVLA